MAMAACAHVCVVAGPELSLGVQLRLRAAARRRCAQAVWRVEWRKQKQNVAQRGGGERRQGVEDGGVGLGRWVEVRGAISGQ